MVTYDINKVDSRTDASYIAKTESEHIIKNNSNHNKHICTAPSGRDFRGAGGQAMWYCEGRQKFEGGLNLLHEVEDDAVT